MGGAVIEDQAIIQDQYLDLFYSQYGTLYDLIPNSPCPSTDPTKSPTETPVDGVVGSIQPPSTTKPTKQQISSTVTSLSPIVSAEVNATKYSQTPSNKKKGKGKNKKYGNQQENPKTVTPKNESKPK